VSSENRGLDPAGVKADTKVVFNIFEFEGIKSIGHGNVIEPYGGLYQDKNSNLIVPEYGFLPENGSGTLLPGAIAELTKQGSRYVQRVLYVFQGNSYGDGETPKGIIAPGPDGILYGTTSRGGGTTCSNDGCGTVYALTPKGSTYTESPAYSFKSTGDVINPQAGVVEYNGVLYGTGSHGGSSASDAKAGYGGIYALTPGSAPSESVIYNFTNGDDGGTPYGVLTVQNGLLYGTASTGGAYSSGGANPGGTLFSITPSGSITILHTFGSGTDGATPHGSVVFDSTGALYGTTTAGGAYGQGMVFKFAAGQYSDIYDFKGLPNDGGSPWSNLVVASNGVLYGTTLEGGGGTCTANMKLSGCGTLYGLSPSSGAYIESFLYSFLGPDHQMGGAFPFAGLILGNDGNLYGTTYNGGLKPGKRCDQPQGCGLVFELTPPAS
jgi:uncharacterized repeat protein (TIGR03803 family)